MKKEFELPNKKVYVKPNLSNPGWVKNPKSPAYFKLEGTFDRLVVAQQRNGQLFNPLTDEEKTFLEKELTMEHNELSIHRKKDNFWHDTYVSLGRDTLTLDLSLPIDYIKYKILLTNKMIVGRDKANARQLKAKYYIEDPDVVAKETKEKVNYNKVAWSQYGKIENDAKKLRTFLIVYNEAFGKATKKVPTDAKLGFLQKEVTSIIESNIKNFVYLINDDSYKTRALISEGVQSGLITKKGLKYYLGEDKIADDLSDTIQFFEDPSNQSTKLTLEEKIKVNL